MTAAAAGLFAGELAIVTGGAGNIGGGIVRALAAEGATVVVLDRDEAGAAAMVATVAAAGGKAEARVVDLADRAATDGTCRAVLEQLGPPHMVVHAASPPCVESHTVFKVPDDVWDETIAVGLGAAHRLGKVFGSAMARSRNRGRILFITSLHAETPRNLAHYAAAKAGMTMVMKELARGLASYGVRVNALAPGWVSPVPVTGEKARLVPLGRAGTAEDVARMATVLLSDRFSAYVTGTTVVVDGGLALHSWVPLRV